MRVSLVVAAFVLAAVLERDAIAQSVVAFEPHHAIRSARAVLTPGLSQRLDANRATATIANTDQLIAFDLGVTSSALHFGLSHHTRLSFDGTEREGNCVEYAELFATVFNRERGSVDAQAWVVRSDAKILGQTMKNPAWKDHDWVLVVTKTPTGSKKTYVDPTLYDLGLGWDITQAVHGDVTTP